MRFWPHQKIKWTTTKNWWWHHQKMTANICLLIVYKLSKIVKRSTPSSIYSKSPSSWGSRSRAVLVFLLLTKSRSPNNLKLVARQTSIFFSSNSSRIYNCKFNKRCSKKSFNKTLKWCKSNNSTLKPSHSRWVWTWEWVLVPEWALEWEWDSI